MSLLFGSSHPTLPFQVYMITNLVLFLCMKSSYTFTSNMEIKLFPLWHNSTTCKPCTVYTAYILKSNTMTTVCWQLHTYFLSVYMVLNSFPEALSWHSAPEGQSEHRFTSWSLLIHGLQIHSSFLIHHGLQIHFSFMDYKSNCIKDDDLHNHTYAYTALIHDDEQLQYMLHYSNMKMYNLFYWVMILLLKQLVNKPLHLKWLTKGTPSKGNCLRYIFGW